MNLFLFLLRLPSECKSEIIGMHQAMVCLMLILKPKTLCIPRDLCMLGSTLPEDEPHPDSFGAIFLLLFPGQLICTHCSFLSLFDSYEKLEPKLYIRKQRIWTSFFKFNL